jgi:protein involved in polysaccharide export with SLBB domain
MLVNGNAATAKVEYFGTEGFGPRDAIFSAWIGSKLFFATPGKELRQAIYDLKPGNPLSLLNDSLGLLKFTINGSASDVINTLGYGGQDAIEIPVAELNTFTGFTPQLYLHDIYLPVKDKSATIANGTWTVTVSTTGTVVFPNGSIQKGASISIADLKTLVAASTDFANFKTRIAAL